MREASRRILRWSVMAAAAFALSSCGTCASSAHEALTGHPEWSLDPLTAAFDQACFCTRYTDAIALTGNDNNTQLFSENWTIQLTLVDPPGQPFPGDPGSAAAVDPGCNNNGKGTSAAVTAHDSVIEETSYAVMFTWYHPAPGDTPPGQPAGVYGCDHLKQGPRGHQGVVTLVVSGTGETCTVSYRGTVSGTGKDPGQPGVQSCHAS